METTWKGTIRAMHTATGLPFPLFSLSFQAIWPISNQFFVLYSSKLVLYMIEGWSFYHFHLLQLHTWNSTLPVYTESKRSDKNFTSSETVFSRVDHYVGHSWWSLVTSDVVTSDQWPSGVTHIVINPRKTVLLRVRFFHSVWLSVDRQWTFFNAPQIMKW